MSEVRGYFKMLETWGGSDYCFNIELLDDLKIIGCVEITQKEMACSLGGRNNDVMRFIGLLGIIIEKHEV